jgi:hypothetical protein
MQDGVSERADTLNFWKNIALASVFFTITPLVIAVSLFSLFTLRSPSGHSIIQSNLIDSPKSGVKVYASLPSFMPTVSGYATSQDARTEIVRQYLKSYESPLEPYADHIVQAADNYGLDYRLTTAIAQKESNLCKKIPPDSNNCWGWGIHSRGTLGFSSFSEGIDEVSKGIRKEYLDKGFHTIEEIMSKYTPLSNGSWAEGVNKFMAEME